MKSLYSFNSVLRKTNSTTETTPCGPTVKEGTSQPTRNSLRLNAARLLIMMILMVVMQGMAWGQTQTYNSSGTFIVPAGVTTVTVQAWGGGARGGGSNENGGGGGGAFSQKTNIAVVPGNSYTVVVGVGGNNTTPNGGDSYFINTSTVLAKGGQTTTNSTGGAGGSAASGVGDVKYSGGSGGGGGNNFGGYGGGGGSSAGTSANGNPGNGNSNDGGVAPTGGGSGGNGAYDGWFGGDFNSAPGQSPGGGGGGRASSSRVQSNGADGRVIITYTVCISPTLYAVTGGGTYCLGDAGKPVGLSSSESGINYQLKIDGTDNGAPVAGTGAAIDFGIKLAGTYTVEATRVAGGCTSIMTGSATVIQNNQVVATVSNKKDISCNAGSDGEITVSASGGISPYTFSVDNGLNYLPANGTDLRVFTGLQANTPYKIRVKDSNGCTSPVIP